MDEEFTIKVSSPGQFVLTINDTEYIGQGSNYSNRQGEILEITECGDFHTKILAKEKWAFLV